METYEERSYDFTDYYGSVRDKKYRQKEMSVMIRKATSMIISISIQMIMVVLIIMFVYSAGVKGFEFGLSVFTPSSIAPAPGKDIMVIVEEGASDLEIAKLLEEKGLISDYKVFLIQAKLYMADMNPDSYTLNTSMTSEKMIEIMAANQEEKE